MKKEEGRCQVGATVDKELWTRLRALSIMQGRTTGETLDDAIKLYFEHMDKENPLKQ
jgi:predicted DNA-binding protein